MPEVQPNDHHRAACLAYGVQDCVHRLRTINVDSEDRTNDGCTLQDGAGRAPVKGPESSGHETDTFEGHGEALR